MPTKTPTKQGFKPLQTVTGAELQEREQQRRQEAAKQRLPSMKAIINWLNPNENESVRATASLTVGGAFAVHGIKVINGSKGEFVSMPSYKSGADYKDIFHAVTAEAREQMNGAVMKAYEQKLAETQDQALGESPGDVTDESDQDESGQGEPADTKGGPVMQQM